MREVLYFRCFRPAVLLPQHMHMPPSISARILCKFFRPATFELWNRYTTRGDCVPFFFFCWHFSSLLSRLSSHSYESRSVPSRIAFQLLFCITFCATYRHLKGIVSPTDITSLYGFSDMCCKVHVTPCTFHLPSPDIEFHIEVIIAWLELWRTIQRPTCSLYAGDNGALVWADVASEARFSCVCYSLPHITFPPQHTQQELKDPNSNYDNAMHNTAGEVVE